MRQIADRLADLPRRENDERIQTLARLQRDHVINGLRRTPLQIERIRGVGPVLAERLRQHGVHAAADVTIDTLHRVPGIGETKITALLTWRAEVERYLQATIPTYLPTPTADAIRQKYRQLRETLAREEASLKKALPAELAAIEARAKREAERLSGEVARLRTEEERLQSALGETTGALGFYESITFRRYVESILSSIGLGGGRPRLAALLAMVGMAILLVAQAATGVASVESLYLAYQPSATPVPPPTMTATITPSPTSTPRRTLTPTINPIPSATVTLPALAIASCIPGDTTREVGEVVDVINGITIRVAIGDESHSVRYIGIGIPEEFAGLRGDAMRLNEQLVAGQQVLLVKDVSETDQDGHLLRYVIASDRFINYELVRQGVATSVSQAPDVACRSRLRQALSAARNAEVGLGKPPPTPKPSSASSNSGRAGSRGSGCSPSYPTVCIPPSPPDLDCGQIGHKRFSVVGMDPHGFDGDNDGIGCER